ncbi:uncharacterized protein LOC144564360 [Carex rostrata]
MREDMRHWAHSTPTPQNRILVAQEKILQFQSLHPHAQDQRVEEELMKEYNRAEDDLQEYWRQRSRTQWHVEGDRNTAYFHATATHRKRRNLIAQIESESREEDSIIEETYHVELTTTPSQEEIRENLFRMGADKASGPDGLTARFFQMNWDLFKEDLTRAMTSVFEIGQTPTKWLASHMILIPKMDQPATPKEYRPIMIRNVIYRLLMKIIASRLQPHMQTIISKNQTAFLKNRSIADNTILLREIIQSFQSKEYKDQSFLLKADINKAFDKVRWEAVKCSLHAINMPKPLIDLIMTAMTSSRVQILINGRGDGFIKSIMGLRQGYPLSPYLFILVMEMLTRRINLSRVQGRIIGVKLAATAPILTNIIYADDLVIMGQASANETKEYKSILNEFGKNSGLFVNPQKSKIWYSKRCEEQNKNNVKQELGARPAARGEKYLGIFMSEDNSQHDMTRKLLTERFIDKMASWKTNTLSHAGHAIMIKSVLTSLPVYYMSIEKLPTKTVKELESTMRRKGDYGLKTQQEVVASCGRRYRGKKVSLEKQFGGILEKETKSQLLINHGSRDGKHAQFDVTSKGSQRQPEIEDRLIWMESKRGIYTTKEGYQLLFKQNQQPINYKEAQICGSENETIMHTLFFCSATRATWYASQFALQVDGLPLNFAITLLEITKNMDISQIEAICNILRSRWKSRNDEIFQGTRADPIATLSRAKTLEYTRVRPQTRETQHQQNPIPIGVPTSMVLIQVDGSWDIKKNAGVGAVIFDTQGNMVGIQFSYLEAQDALEAEAIAINTMVERIATSWDANGSTKYQIYTDSKNLTKALATRKIEDLQSWRATQIIARTMQLTQQMGGRFEIIFARREYLNTAHNLANWARREKQTFSGYPSEDFCSRMKIELTTNQALFSYGE